MALVVEQFPVHGRLEPDHTVDDHTAVLSDDLQFFRNAFKFCNLCISTFLHRVFSLSSLDYPIVLVLVFMDLCSVTHFILQKNFKNVILYFNMDPCLHMSV